MSSKILHHRINAHQRKDRIGFEIVLPCDTETVTGIAISARPGRLNLAAAGTQTELAGLLTLCWDAPGHVFYQGPVHTTFNHDDDYRWMNLSPADEFLTGSAGFADRGTRMEPVGISVPGHLRTLQGYYIDVINRLGGNDENYPIDLFIYYQDHAA